MFTRPTTGLRLFQIVCLVLVGVVFAVLRHECLSAEAAGVACLQIVSDPISRIVKFGTFILNRHWDYPNYEMVAAAVGLGLVVLALLWRRACSWWSFFYLAALVLTGLGEFAALYRKPLLTLRYDIGAVVAAVLAFAFLLRRSPELLSKGWLETKRLIAKISLVEVLFVTVILTIACVSRFYQLNRNPSGYDAEACPHRIIADSWQTILQQEVGGTVQQSSGISWVVMHRLFTRINHQDLFYLDERILGVAISLFGCLVMYFFMRNLRGAYAGVLALTLYVLGPLDLEWSRLPVQHHIPVVLALLLCWAMLNALSRRSYASFIAVAILMTLTKFVYPSAKLVLFGPLLGAIGVLLFQRREWRGSLRKLSLVFLGLFLFVGVRSAIYYLVYGRFQFVHPFDNPYPSYTPPSQLERLQQMLHQGLYFFYEVFYAPAQQTHWTNHATVMPVRSLSSFTVVFMVLAFIRLVFQFKKPEALVFIGMILGGIIPGMATELADRRIAVSLVLCLALGVLEFSWLMDSLVARGSRVLAGVLKVVVLVSLVVCVGLSQTTAFFSRPTARPIQMEVGDTVLRTLKDDTLVVYLADERRCEMFYSLFSKMLESNGSIAFATVYEGPKGAKEQIVSPEPVLTSNYYTQSRLAPQIEALKAKKNWSHYLFIFQPTSEREEWRRLLKETYPEGRETIVNYSDVFNQKTLLFEVDNPIAPPNNSDQQ